MAADSADILNTECFINSLRFYYFEPQQGTPHETDLQHAVYNGFQNYFIATRINRPRSIADPFQTRHSEMRLIKADTMTPDALNILTMAKLIQTAVAPVFLITGVAATLGVLSNRLARITDRARLLEKKIRISADDSLKTQLTTELRALWKRARCIHISFSLSVLSALLVCTVVMALFVSHLLSMNLNITIGISFVGAMLLLILAMLSLLVEVFLATRSMR